MKLRTACLSALSGMRPLSARGRQDVSTDAQSQALKPRPCGADEEPCRPRPGYPRPTDCPPPLVKLGGTHPPTPFLRP